MTVTDAEGNHYYDVDEASAALDISRSTYLKKAKEAKLVKWKPEGEKKVYWRVEDVMSLKDRPKKMIPIPPKGRPAPALVC